MNKMFKLSSDFVVKDAGTDSNFITIEGYANTTTKDRVGDVIIEAAWNNGGLDNYKKNPIILAYHNYQKPIGTCTELSVDSKGLKIIANISNSAVEVVNLIKEGILKAFSVGFRVKDAEYDSTTDIFVVKDLELYEISVVSVPANADSVFSLKKSFENTDEYETFKKEFVKQDTKEEDVNTDDAFVKTILDHMKTQEEQIGTLITAALDKLNDNKEKEIMNVEKDKGTVIEGGVPTVAQLEAKIKEMLLEQDKSTAETIKTLKQELEENKGELKSLRDSKISFEEKGKGKDIETKEVANAVLLAKILGVKPTSTKYAKEIIEKSGKQHLASMDSDWEQTFSTTVQNDIRLRLVVEPLITKKIAMTTPTMHFPINPEAGVGYWIPTGDFNSAKSTGDEAQVGIPQVHLITDETLTAYKLATKEYIGYEEEEDSIIPLMPIIMEALGRRMARSSDIALLRGAGSGSAQPTYDPISGLTTLATAGSAVTSKSIASGGKVSIADLATVRRGLGNWGLEPSDVVYVVSTAAYYDLLEDDDFRTIDLVGDRATILRGQIGSVNGSPVIVSGNFEAKANGKFAVVAFNPANFVLGELRSTRVERDVQVVEQQTVLISTRRMAFRAIVPNYGVAALKWIT